LAKKLKKIILVQSGSFNFGGKVTVQNFWYHRKYSYKNQSTLLHHGVA